MKLPIVSGKETLNAMQKAGFMNVRWDGSHAQLEKTIDGHVIRVTVPVHANRDLPKRTLNKILKQSGLSREEFERLR